MALCLGAYPAAIPLTVYKILTFSHSLLLFSHTVARKSKTHSGRSPRSGERQINSRALKSHSGYIAESLIEALGTATLVSPARHDCQQ